LIHCGKLGAVTGQVFILALVGAVLVASAGWTAFYTGPGHVLAFPAFRAWRWHAARER
jgi:hypothetical protein